MAHRDRLRSYEKVGALFNDVHDERPLISRSVVSKVVARYLETGGVNDLLDAADLKWGIIQN